MLPQISAEENIPQVGRKVYINPNFQGQVATALQLQGRVNANTHQTWDRPAIHINPHFLQRQRDLQLQQQQQQQQQQQRDYQLQQLQQQMQLLQQQLVVATPPPAKIISKASTCLVRKQPVKCKPKPTPTSTIRPQPPLVSISKRKLVRQSASIVKTTTTTTAPTTTIASPAKRTKYKLVRAISLNTNSSTPLVKKRRSRDFVARYALKRTNDSVTGKKINLITHMLKPSVNKSISMVSIHGVMYKKTSKNKLTKLDASRVSKTAEKPLANGSTGRTLFVRGTKFVLDPSGCRLTRVQAHSPQRSVNKSLSRRIDIGGLTYVSSPKAQNVFIRTTNHMARAHLTTAKQRSLQLLNRSLVKTNVPCAIFQRLGKCAAHSRGKCRRLHDKRQVAICPSFLRGECTKTDCLLSHNVTLEKMPVCRYFLKGVCVREDCPYLHKKLSCKAEICIDFLRGYCARAADCNMRHEFVCPELARLGKCELTNCSYCKQIKKVTTRAKPKPKIKVLSPVVLSPVEEAPGSSRYFKCKSDKSLSKEPDQQLVNDDPDANIQAEDVENGNGCSLRKRPKLGTLPAFIPLGEK